MFPACGFTDNYPQSQFDGRDQLPPFFQYPFPYFPFPCPPNVPHWATNPCNGGFCNSGFPTNFPYPLVQPPICYAYPHPYPASSSFAFPTWPSHDTNWHSSLMDQGKRHCCGCPNHVSNLKEKNSSKFQDGNCNNVNCDEKNNQEGKNQEKEEGSNGQRLDDKIKWCLPLDWMPRHSCTEISGKQQDDVKEILPSPQIEEQVQSKAKVIPIEDVPAKHGDVAVMPSHSLNNSHATASKKQQDHSIGLEARNSEKGSSDRVLKPGKSLKFPRICLRVDPLPKCKNGNGHSPSRSLSTREENNVVVTKNVKISKSGAATAIQSAFRGFQVRKWEPLKKLKAIRKIHENARDIGEKINAIEASLGLPMDKKEIVVIGETIMNLLLKLDTIQGLHPSIREARKSVARELTGLQEKLDALSNFICRNCNRCCATSMTQCTEREENLALDGKSIDVFPEANEVKLLTGGGCSQDCLLDQHILRETPAKLADGDMKIQEGYLLEETPASSLQQGKNTDAFAGENLNESLNQSTSKLEDGNMIKVEECHLVEILESSQHPVGNLSGSPGVNVVESSNQVTANVEDGSMIIQECYSMEKPECPHQLVENLSDSLGVDTTGSWKKITEEPAGIASNLTEDQDLVACKIAAKPDRIGILEVTASYEDLGMKSFREDREENSQIQDHIQINPELRDASNGQEHVDINDLILRNSCLTTPECREDSRNQDSDVQDDPIFSMGALENRVEGGEEQKLSDGNLSCQTDELSLPLQENDASLCGGWNGEAVDVENEDPSAMKEGASSTAIAMPKDNGKNLADENSELMKIVQGLIESGREHMELISNLNGRVRDLQTRLARKRRLKLKRNRTAVRTSSVGVATS